MKKIFLLTIMVLITSSFCQAQTNKTQPTGSGTADEPYEVSTLGNLSWLTQSILEQSKIYIQTADIDAAETATWDLSDDDGDGDKFNDPNDLTTDGDNDGWQPIAMFNGSYNGQGHMIDSITIQKGSNYGDMGIGFFSIIDGGTIENLGITNVDITGPEVVGVLAGYCKGNIVTNCYTTGKMTPNNTEKKYKYGGFFARINTGISEISNCYSDVEITGNSLSYYIGGFAGNIKGLPAGSIENCYALGNIIDGGQACAGFVGKNEAEELLISECYSTGNVRATERSGGFVAYNKNGAVIENCYSLGDVTRADGSEEVDLGGFCGYNSKSTISNCYNTGSVFYGDTVITDKGFVGRDGSGTYNACFFDSTVSNQDSCVAGIAKSTEEMQQDSTFINAGWDFTDVWQIVDSSYPTLKNIVSAIDEEKYNDIIPSGYELRQNYPNPFNPLTVIGFSLSQNADVNLVVYNLLGQKVAELLNGKMMAGYHEVSFNATNLSSGVYIYRIKVGSFVSVKKMMLIK